MTQTRSRSLALAAVTSLLGVGAVWGAAPASAETLVAQPEEFTSAYTVTASPDAIVDAQGNRIDGEPGATGRFDIAINAESDIICWQMDLTGVEGDYQSLTKTGVTLREAPQGWGGPPRISVPEPVQDGAGRTGSGCAQGPFTTGVDGEDGRDSGRWFSLADVEADPASYSVDVRTAAFPDGAVRGQLTAVPVEDLALDPSVGGAAPVPSGAPDTGFGGLSQPAAGSAGSYGVGMAALGVAGLGAVMSLRRTRAER